MTHEKIEKWRKDFLKEKDRLQIEYDAFFLSGKLEKHYLLNVEDHYSLTSDGDNQSLRLEILETEKLPAEIKERLVKMFQSTKPSED